MGVLAILNRASLMFQDMHGNGMFAPVRAFVEKDGTIILHSLVSDCDVEILVLDSISKIEVKFTELASTSEIQGCAIFYHTSYIDPQLEEFSLPSSDTESH